MANGIFANLRNRGLAFVARDQRNPSTDRAAGAEGTTSMATGIIKSLRDRGFGFIHRDSQSGSNDLFFHQSSVADNGFDQLREGQHVSFEEEADPRDRNRQRAVNVRPTGDGDA